MSEALEAAMLVCFGVSWPINLVKNVRAHSAKGMSLHFILLIIAGYLAGITAKLITHRINYVLAVYFFNLIVVSCNLLVYFRNRRIDCMDAPADEHFIQMEDRNMEQPAQHERSHQEIIYQEMNEVAPKGGTVFFGSNRFAELPVTELVQSFHLHETVCNRSIPDVTIDAIAPMLDVCVLDLEPSKVFVNLGDADLENPAFDADAFISGYEWLLYTIHKKTHAQIYVVSLASDTTNAHRLNARLKALAENDGCDYIDISDAAATRAPELSIFSELKNYMHSHPVDFAEAMNLLTI